MRLSKGALYFWCIASYIACIGFGMFDMPQSATAWLTSAIVFAGLASATRSD